MADTGYAKAIFKAGKAVWAEAISEIVVVVVVSLIPLFGAALRATLPADSTIPFGYALGKALFSGQLLFYALGLIATVVWQSNKDFQSFFPLRSAFNLYALISIVISSVVIGYDPELASVNKAILTPASVAIFTTSVIAYVLMAIISKVHVNVGKALAVTDARLGDAVRKSRGLPK